MPHPSFLNPRSSPLPRLMLVTGGLGIGEPRENERMTAALRGGVGIVQLRDHGAGAGELLARAQALRRLSREALLLVNDRVDVALAAGAGGVQLGARSLPSGVARLLLGTAALIGRSVHSVTEAKLAAAEGADFLIVGTIYPSATHPERAPAGLALLEAVAAAVELPCYAIGGITAANAGECRRHGAHGVAVMRAISEAPDTERAACQLREAVSRLQDAA